MLREIVFDTETTGLSPKEGDRLVEIGAIELINHIPTGRTYHQYINPMRDMPEEAFKVHGLSNDFLSNYPKFSDIAKDFINFVGDDDDIRVFPQHFGDGGEFSFCEDTAARVAGRVDEQSLCFGRDGFFKILCGDFEVVRHIALYDDRHAAAKFYHFGRGYPERSGDDDLVAVVDDSLQYIVDSLLRTVRNKDVALLVVQTVVAFQLLCDSLAQCRRAWYRRIVRVVAVDSVDRCLLC